MCRHIALIALVLVSACSSIAKKNSLGRPGVYHLETLGTSIGPSSASLGDTSASTLGGELFGLGAIFSGAAGGGIRAGYMFDAAKSGEPKIKYTGVIIEPMVFFGHPRLMAYFSPGIVVSGHVTPVGASMVVDQSRSAIGFRPLVGIHFVAVTFNDSVSYRLFAEVPYLITADTDVGRYHATSLLLGSILTF